MAVGQLPLVQRKFLGWVVKNVAYMPGSDVPEAFVWRCMKKDSLSESVADISDPKLRFDKLARLELGRADYEDLSSTDILGTQLRRLATIPEDNQEVRDLLVTLQSFAASKS